MLQGSWLKEMYQLTLSCKFFSDLASWNSHRQSSLLLILFRHWKQLFLQLWKTLSFAWGQPIISLPYKDPTYFMKGPDKKAETMASTSTTLGNVATKPFFQNCHLLQGSDLCSLKTRYSSERTPGPSSRLVTLNQTEPRPRRDPEVLSKWRSRS